MNTGISRLDPQVRDPIAPQLQALNPMERRVIAVMPLAFLTKHGCGFVPGSQASALNVAFQLARLEIERTLSAQDPTLESWFAEQGRLWPWLLKRGVGPEGLKAHLPDAIQKVPFVLEVDHIGSFWNFLSEETRSRLPSHTQMKEQWKNGEAPLLSFEDLHENMGVLTYGMIDHSPYEPRHIAVVPEFEVKERWQADLDTNRFKGINFAGQLGFSPMRDDNGPNCKGVSGAYLRVIAERFRPQLIYRVSEYEQRRTAKDHLIGRVTPALNMQGEAVFRTAWPQVAEGVQVGWNDISSFIKPGVDGHITVVTS